MSNGCDCRRLAAIAGEVCELDQAMSGGFKPLPEPSSPAPAAQATQLLLADSEIKVAVRQRTLSEVEDPDDRPLWIWEVCDCG